MRGRIALIVILVIVFANQAALHHDSQILMASSSRQVLQQTDLAAADVTSSAVHVVAPSAPIPVTSSGTQPVIYQSTLSTPPTITSITPASGLLSGGSTITITGTNLTGATAVDFGTTPATSFSVVSNTEITAVVPATSTPGLTDVTITTPEGTSIANAPTAGYLYVTASAYTPLTPYRICDTRANNPSNLSGLDLTQCEGKTLGPNSSLTIQAAGTNPSGATSGGVPTNASAVVLNVTVTNTTATSYLTAYPAGLSSPPIVSDLNWTQGDTVPNLVVVNVSSSGQVAFYNSLGSTDLIVDVLGYYG